MLIDCGFVVHQSAHSSAKRKRKKDLLNGLEKIEGGP